MPVEIKMPELGEGVHEGTVSRWLKKVGDLVKEDEPIVEIMTDKVNTELQAPASGTLIKILIQEGEPVEVFHAMGLIAEEDEVVDAVPGPTAPTANAAPTEAPASALPPLALSENGRRWYSPVVRRMAKEHGVPEVVLASISGTGTGGRVTKKDLEAHLASAPGSSPVAAAMPEPKAPPALVLPGADQEVVKLVGMRKMIAEAMVRSAAVPTVSTLTEVDVTPMVKFRETNKEAFSQTYGVKLTYTPFFIKALTEALVEFPLVNSSLQGDQIVMNRGVHMGIAVSLGAKGDEGLIVPVIRDCHKKSLIDVAKELESIAARARANSLGVADVQGGTFTLTNPGSYGAVLGTPMVNAPQAAILGTYTIKQMPIVIDGMIGIRSVMNLVLTYDHRLIDGLLAGRFLQSVRGKLEKFDFFK